MKTAILKPQAQFPRITEYKAVFPITPKTIFAYKDTIYADGNLSDDLIVHEQTHLTQQEKEGPDKWVDNFLNDPKFRLIQEIEAYQKQLESIRDRNHRAKVRFQLKDFNVGVPSQLIQFYKLNADGTSENGTTLENVLAVCIERLTYLNNRFPCRQNALALTKMEEAVFWLEARTKDRIARGVEGKHLA